MASMANLFELVYRSTLMFICSSLPLKGLLVTRLLIEKEKVCLLCSYVHLPLGKQSNIF